MKIQSFLPVFSGFYNTIFEPDETPYIEDGKTYDDYNWDYASYYRGVGIQATHTIECWLRELGLNVKCGFECVVSPREYNFGNDSVNVTYTLSKTALKNIKAYLYKHLDLFKVYLKERYTSCSGFNSWYSNQNDEWLNDLENTHKFGAVLNFILLNENSEAEMDLYYACDGIGIDSELKELENN